MVDNQDFDNFDDILNSLNSPTDSTGADELDLDDFLSQLRVDFPPDFDSQAVAQFAASEYAQQEADAAQIAPGNSGEGRTSTPRKKSTKKKKDTSNQPADGFYGTVNRHHRGINLTLAIIALLLVAGIAAVFLIQNNSDPYGNKIIGNVRVAGVYVGGMTKKQAISAVTSAVGSSYSSNDMVVTLGQEEIVLAASQTTPVLDVTQAVELAFAYGRTGSATQMQQEYRAALESPIDIPLGSSLSLNSDYIRSVISNFLSQPTTAYVPSGYALEGTRPALDADEFDETTPCQNLVLTIGTPGGEYDTAGILNTIADAYSRRDFQPVVPTEYLLIAPAALDINAIYSELHVDAVEAIQGNGSDEGVPGSCGYTFSLEDARQQLNDASYGDVVTIPMEYIIPEKLSNNGAFAYKLATYATPISGNDDYNQNLEHICQILNGTTLAPGETFSFNNLVSKRTEDNGYLLAPAHGDQCLEEEVGGGADQVATTLYVAAMSSGMTLTERHNASHVCPYTTKGTELTVSSWRDLKFRNPLTTTIMIRAKVTDTQLVIRIFSEQDVDFEVKMEINQLSTSKYYTTTVRKNIADGYKGQQVLVEGAEGGQFNIVWYTYKDGSTEPSSKFTEYVNLPSLNKAIVELIA